MDRSDLLLPNFFMAPAVRKARQKPRLRVQWCKIGIPRAGAWSLSLPQGHGRSMETKPALMPGFRPSKQRPSSISWTRTQINDWNRQGRKCAYGGCGHTRIDIVTFWALPTVLPPKYFSQASTKPQRYSQRLVQEAINHLSSIRDAALTIRLLRC